jgi:hypothetical protein
MPQRRTEAPSNAGTDSTIPGNVAPELSPGNPELSEVKMKHYLRDIMGEQSSEPNPDT